MVYRGRPSTGCKKCRERKIKCDERPGGCMKCAERGLQCPGYDRNTVDAFFLDETAHVQAKAKKSKAKAIAARNARDIHDPWTALSEALTRKDFGIQITPSLVDQGISFFMSYYCIGIDQPPTHSAAYHKHLSTHGFNPLVATSMTALGIAGVANLHLDSRLKREATRWYLDAIKMVNAAISSPKDVKADSTLTSINLLSMFEATNNDHTLDGWINHVDGAASLLRLRGPDQFSTPAGQRLYLHTVGQLVMNCMGRGMSLPEYIQDMNSEIVKHLDNTDPRNRFFFLHAKCIDLRARILNQEMFSLEDMIESALELDREAVSIFKNQGLEWAYDVVLCGKQEGIFEDSYHVYPTAIAAQTWNWMRYNRIYFHDIIRNSILAGFAASPPMLIGQKYHEQLEESTQTLYKLQSDIIASMPQFLHDVSPVVPPKTDSRAGDEWPSSPSPFTPLSDAVAANLPSNDRGALKAFDRNFRGEGEFLAKRLVGTGSVTDRLPIVRVAGGYSTVWALYVAAAMPMASSESQDYVYTCFTRVEREFGINQARVLANALQYKRHLASKGAIAFGICPQYLPVVQGPYGPVEPSDSKLSHGSPDNLMEATFQAALFETGAARLSIEEWS